MIKFAVFAAFFAAGMQVAAAAGFDCERFKQNPDGSWRALEVVEIYGPRGRIDFTPEETYRRGQEKLGLDMAKLLDANCPKK